MDATCYVQSYGSQEVHFIHIPDLNKTIRFADNKCDLVNGVPAGATESIFDATLSGKIENCRGFDWNLGINPIDLLYIINDLKVELGE